MLRSRVHVRETPFGLITATSAREPKVRELKGETAASFRRRTKDDHDRSA
jgi:hypothetical protein